MKIPQWIIWYTAIAALMGIGFSIMFAAGGDFDYAARNAAPAVASLAVLGWARTSASALLAIMVARLTVELGDIANNVLTNFEPQIMIFAVVMGIIDLLAVLTLIKLVKS